MEKFLKRPICNNNPESAPNINGKPFIICWRCIGSIIGAGCMILIRKYAEINIWYMGFFAIPAVVDWTLKKQRKKKPSNTLRFVTGVMLGLAIGAYVPI